jgi:hypothetical protein
MIGLRGIDAELDSALLTRAERQDTLEVFEVAPRSAGAGSSSRACERLYHPDH